MLEQDAGVFFVYAYGVLDGLAGTSAVDKVGTVPWSEFPDTSAEMRLTLCT